MEPETAFFAIVFAVVDRAIGRHTIKKPDPSQIPRYIPSTKSQGINSRIYLFGLSLETYCIFLGLLSAWGRPTLGIDTIPGRSGPRPRLAFSSLVKPHPDPRISRQWLSSNLLFDNRLQSAALLVSHPPSKSDTCLPTSRASDGRRLAENCREFAVRESRNHEPT